ncbi:hypothetical protein FKM82_007222 [Ascaphus truei]
MADSVVKSSSKNTEKKVEAEMPPPPPPDSAQLAVLSSGSQEQSFLPLPPPKESFSKFHEQRQVNELKRLYRHMHPELRKNLEHAVTDDLSEILNTDDPNQQTSVNVDAVMPVEVQSMRWIFENWNLDSIGEHQGSKKLGEDETVLSGNVKNTSLKFVGQPCGGDRMSATEVSGEDQRKGDVKTALWLFETQPLDSLNKIYPDETDVQEAVLKDPVERGDVKGTKHLFETNSLNEIGRCNSVEEHSILQLKSEIQELKGDVKKTVKLFQTEPLCAIKDKTGNIHEIKSICREETQSNTVNTARWLFETQPLDTIHKDTSSVQIIRGISLEEMEKGGVSATKWIFETQPLDTIKEHIEEGVFQALPDTIQGAGGIKHGNLLEARSIDSMQSESTGKVSSKEEVLAGDVRSTLWLFETQPMEKLKGNFEVGQLKKLELLNEEKGDVKHTKHVFETCSLDSISKTSTEDQSEANNTKEIVKGDVKSFKNLFETLPLDSIKNTRSILVSNQEDIKAGNVKANQSLFETTPLYAIEDSLGNFHEVTSVSRDQVVSGDVKNYKWMFETKQLDQFNDSTHKLDIIKGITKQEIVSGNVRTARWLFETQPVDVIHQEMNATEKHSSVQKEVSQKGDVKKCRWLFETQPVDMLYDKAEKNLEKESQPQGDVKSCTWMFETQPLDSLRETEERYIQVSTAINDNLKGVDVKTTKHLFETEPLDNIFSGSELKKIIRYSSRVEMQSGEVSRVKEMFESKPKEGTSLIKGDKPEEENIMAGSVNKFTWLFENCPMDSMANNKDGFQEIPPEDDVRGGDVGGKKFIFETYSLDQIQQESDETEIKKVQEAVSKGDVKSCTMLFETKPLYAIQDKEGEYHEVTSVKKEEVMKGDVRGAKWLFETKPLDRFNKDEEVFVIRAVTQEDIEKGCVKSARWRFETEPLDSITDDKKHLMKSVDDVQKGDVQLNKQLFESQQLSQKKYVRLVSVSDVQKGNVRTSTWLFENQPIDCLKGESEEHRGIITVQREDNQKGDVKRCTWLFESQPLDSLKDTEVSTTPQAQEVAPQANVKSTTWLFESTPLDQFYSSPKTSVEQGEITVKDTLEALCACKTIQYHGIIIENFDGGNVKMAKYQLMNQAAAEILKEEIVGGNLQRILLQLLHRTDVEAHGLLVEEINKGELQVTKLQLLSPSESGDQEEGHVRDDVAKGLQVLLNQDASIKTGIIMEESEKGSVKIIIYSISSQCKFNVDQQEIVKGDVKSTIGSLLASSQEHRPAASVIREQNEKGNVHLYTSCIEKGDLGYLKNLQADSEIEALMLSQRENTKPIHQENKVPLEQHHQTMKESENQSKSTQGTECVNMDSGLNSTLYSCIQPAIKENVVSLPVDIKVTTHSLEKAKNECYKIENRDTMPRNAKEMNTALQEATATNPLTAKENLSASEKTCFVGATTCKTPPKECTSGNDLQAALLDLRQATAEAKTIQHQVQCKLQKSTQEIQLRHEQVKGKSVVSVQPALQYQEGATSKHAASAVTSAQETRKSYASLQKSTASTKKVSASEEEEKEVQKVFEAGQESAGLSIKDGVDSPKPPKHFVNPFNDSDYNMQSVQEEREQDVVRGDVKAAIRALQSASSEQKEVEREQVVRGNLKSTLQSLEKSNINVSKGDFKAAMIYRNAGQSYSVSKLSNEAQQVRNQATNKSMQRSDNDFPPSSAAVIGKESCQPPKPSNIEATKGESTKVNDSITKTHDSAQKQTSEKRLDGNAKSPSKSQALITPRKKPVPPPKPEYLSSIARPASQQSNKMPLTSTSSPSYPKPTNQNNNSNSKAITSPEHMPKREPCTVDGLLQKCCISPSAKEETDCKKEMLLHKTNEISQEKREQQSSLFRSKKHQKECKIHVTESKIGQLVSEDSNVPPNQLHVQTQELEDFGPSLEENLLSKEVNCDKVMLRTSEGQSVSQRKKGVTVTESKDSHILIPHSEHQGVVMREKKKKETEDEKRKRLSVHMDEIMKDNVNAAMDIFENLRKQDELQKILNQVEELEEETFNGDERSVKGLFENVQEWVVSSQDGAKPPLKQKKHQKDESFELLKEDAESVSSVELAFEDLEKASAEIKHLKEQTLARLLDIEVTIKKALYSVSNLKSESDISGLSGLFRESLGSSANVAPTNYIRKISIVSSKAKAEKPTPLSEQKLMVSVNVQDTTAKKKTELVVATVPHRAISPASPSFITIESAARKQTEQTGDLLPSAHITKPLENGQVSQDLSNHKQDVGDNEQRASFQVQKGLSPHCTQQFFDQVNQWSSACDYDSYSQGRLPSITKGGVVAHNSNASLYSPSSPLNSQRQKSVLELKTGPEKPKLIGTTIVTEKYEESDQFGNTMTRSKTSTTVTQQSDTQSSSAYEVVSAPSRYEVTASPILRRHVIPPVGHSKCNGRAKETGGVFVTFGNSKLGQK